MAKLYTIASLLLAPLLPLWLELRRRRGKEDTTRGHERLGYASAARPLGMLVWIHAASVGEANSVLLFIERLKAEFPAIHILLTTGTVTSAQLMQKALPKPAIHQYAPVDTPAATQRFMRHWRPDIALWVESELWPNLIDAANQWQCFMGIINARMSEKSFRMWNKFPGMIRPMMQAFDVVHAQSTDDGKRMSALGAHPVYVSGNLKYDAKPLGCNAADLVQWKKALAQRTVLLAASTHPGEDKQVASAHQLLRATRSNLLTIIVPRHPQRGAQIAEELGAQFNVALRSKQEAPTDEVEFYIADTLGELGLFFRLCDIAFMGGSLVPHGGQNPLEAARLHTAILTGPHTHNFSQMYQQLEAAGGCIRVKNAADLAAQLSTLLSNPARKQALQRNAAQWVQSKSGTSQRLLDAVRPVLTIRKTAP